MPLSHTTQGGDNGQAKNWHNKKSSVYLKKWEFMGIERFRHLKVAEN